jgi:membrane-bound hydrogenase subunit beta
MTEEKILTAEEIIKYFTDKFNTKILDIKIKKRSAGVKKNESIKIWMKIDKNAFKEIIKHLCALQSPHLAVISGNDLGNFIELIYHFTLNYWQRMSETLLNISVELPKSNPEIESICDLIPGALVSEREKQEFLGVKIIGIPDNRRLFLPEDLPEGIYPWRKDETGPEKLYRNLHEVKK